MDIKADTYNDDPDIKIKSIYQVDTFSKRKSEKSLKANKIISVYHKSHTMLTELRTTAFSC
ncbi:UNVERIFIED_CONTAM: hypothetical protein NCL1_14051 [Trichonephila clavipes]